MSSLVIPKPKVHFRLKEKCLVCSGIHKLQDCKSSGKLVVAFDALKKDIEFATVAAAKRLVVDNCKPTITFS